MTTHTVTKRLAKQGEKTILIIPKVLGNHLKPSQLVEVSITIVEEEG